jgi:hypothetical protein
MKQPTNSLNIFIFYSSPPPNYLKYLTQFVNISMNSDLLIYSMDNKGELGQLSVLTNLILDLTSNHNQYISVLVYVENLSIFNNMLFYDKNWFNIFDCIDTQNIVMIYKETLIFKKALFNYNATCNEKELIIQYLQTDNTLLNKYFIYDNITINEFFDLITRVNNKTDIFDILIERRPIQDNNLYVSNLYTNNQPIKSLLLFKNTYGFNEKNNSLLSITKNNINTTLLKKINTKMFQLNKKKILEYISLK